MSTYKENLTDSRISNLYNFKFLIELKKSVSHYIIKNTLENKIKNFFFKIKLKHEIPKNRFKN